MFTNFIKVALRNLWKRKLFSVINIVGLSVGIACFFLISVHVMDEFSYDNFHLNGKNLYRVALERIYPDNVVNYAVIPHSIPIAMLNDLPAVEKMTRLLHFQDEVVFRYEDVTYEENKIIFADPNFFEIFNIPVIEGDPSQALASQNGLVFTKETAHRYFGDEVALGKRISTPQGEFLVSAVCENVPPNSHLEFDFVGSIELLGFTRQPNYASFSVVSYIDLKDGTAPGEIEAKMPALVEQYAAGQIQARAGISYQEYVAAGNGYNYFLQPIRSIHLHSHLTNEIKPNGNILYIYILIAIALFLIVIACINFMNLATARAVARAREVGIRKIVGSLRGSLIRQFLMEALLVSLISMLIAAALVQLVLPLFNGLAGKHLEISYVNNPVYLIILLALGIGVGLLAGSYPALVLSAYQPATILKGRFSTSRKGVLLRNILVVFQFAVSIVLISMTLMVSRQMDYMQNKDQGFNPNDLIVLERAYSLGTQVEAFKQEVRNIPGVKATAGSNTTIQGGFYYGIMFQTEQDSEIKTTRGMTVDSDFVKALDLEILEGRGFQNEFDDAWSVLINESSIREFGWNDPVGMKLKRIGDPGEPVGDYTVIGVVKDFHYNSLHEDIDSFVLFSFESAPEEQRIYPLLNIRFRPENTRSVLAGVEQAWNKFTPEQPFSYFFQDDRLEELYHNEQTSGKIFAVFSVLAILIACIGLFGLSAYTAEMRTKEIGIRKVLGSTALKIIILLSRDFARLILFAFVFAVPLAYFAMHQWLQNFAFRLGVQVWTFVFAGAAALFIAQLTISFQAGKAANANPANTLKFE